ncbi:MAG: hypothetical protein EA396_14970 [Anaerolineaceae bacterium]|nr:MAG: hypothetical protein EA396_14970 [Anaerolineaceae bacterium]
MINMTRTARNGGHIRLFLLLLCWLIAVTISTAAEDDDGQQPSPAANRFGVVEGMWFPEMTCDLGVGWERLIFDWAAHQPTGPDEFVGFLNIPDEWLTNAAACGREIVAVVKNVPEWATDGIVGAGVPRGLYLPVDDPDNLWANFMRQTAAYYAPRGVTRFIILNEPDIQFGTYGFEFDGTLEDYFMMVKVGTIAAREGNPAARIHLAGTTYWHDVNSGERLYTDRLLERIAADPDAAEYDGYFDALSLHIYFRTDSVYDIVSVYRRLLDQHGFEDKQIWIVETNASPNRDPDWLVERPQFQITLAQQAAYVVQAAAQALAAGVERIAVYKLYDQLLPEGAESFGILNPATRETRPAFVAWQTVIAHLHDVADAEISRNERANVVRARHHNGRQTVIAWARTEQAATLSISATGDKAYLVHQSGETRIIRPTDGRYALDLPAAECESGAEGCVVGGAVWMLVQPEGAIRVYEVDRRGEREMIFGEVMSSIPQPSD